MCILPIIFLHLWVYLKPGLYEYESKAFTWVILIFLVSISLGFVFGYVKIIPLAWQFFVGFELKIEAMPYSIMLEARIKDYMDLLFSFTCLVVLAFQIPCLVGIALLTSIVEVDTLIKKKTLYILFRMGYFGLHNTS